MNKVVINILSAVGAFILLAGCINDNPARQLDNFVDRAELKSDSYNAQDWEKSICQYEKLVEEYTASDKSYTEAEKQMAARAIGRYHSLLLKNGIKASASYLEELKTILPAYLEGLVDGIDENAGDLGKTLEGLFDSEELEKAFEGLGEKLENIFGSLDEE